MLLLVSVLLERENLSNEEKLFAINLIEYSCFRQGAVVAGVSADSTDDKIVAQDNKIISIINNNSAQAQVDQPRSYSKLNNKKIFKLKTTAWEELNDCR